MSFSRLVKRIKDRFSDDDKGLSLIDELNKQILNPKRFSRRKVNSEIIAFAKAIDDSDFAVAYAMFMELYASVINIHPRAEQVFHLSSLESDCERQLWFDIVAKAEHKDRVIRSHSPELINTFDLGTWFHLYAQQKLKQAGILADSEVPVINEELHINSRADGIVRMPDERLLEIKTMRSFDFGKSAFGAFDRHKKQAGCYATELKLPTVQFLYFNKDTSEKKEFIYTVDRKDTDPMYDKIHRILDAKSPPKRTVCDRKDCATALACSFRTQCFSTK